MENLRELRLRITVLKTLPAEVRTKRKRRKGRNREEMGRKIQRIFA